MLRISLYLRLCAAAFAAFACTASAADETPAASSAEVAPLDAAAAWRTMYERGSADTIRAANSVAVALHAGLDGVDADACRAHAGEIEPALANAPVNLALRYAAYQCADTLGDADLAARRLADFSALVRYGLDNRTPYVDDAPIRVTSEYDVDTFVRASGQQLLYSYYDVESRGRYLPLVVALWDPERRTERVVVFDYLDTRMRLLRDEPKREFPIYRRQLAEALLKSLDQAGSPLASTAQQLRATFSLPEIAQRRAAIEALARDYKYSAVRIYAMLCLLLDGGDCADRAVDVLLPWAEKREGQALALLALAYENGLGVRRDHRNAQLLIDAADRALGEHRGSRAFAGWTALRTKRYDLPKLVRATIERGARDGLVVDEFIVATLAAAASKDGQFDAAKRSALQHAAEAGLPDAQNLHGTVVYASGDRAQARLWLERAAAAGSLAAQRTLAQGYERGDIVDGGKPDLERARHWRREAATGGDAASMLWLAHDQRDRVPGADGFRAQQGWLESAYAANSAEGALELAALYASGGEGVAGDERIAEKILRALVARPEGADARRRLAALLLHGKQLPHDPAQARTLLEQNISRGDEVARLQLARELAVGAFGADHKAEGRAQLEALVAKNDAGAMVELGYALTMGPHPDVAQAVALWTRAYDLNDLVAANNIAWALCTSVDKAARDPARGLEWARKVASGEDAPIAYLDTLAACHAASGDFDAAVRVETQAIERARAQNRPPATFIDAATRRVAQFRKREPYVEQVDE